MQSIKPILIILVSFIAGMLAAKLFEPKPQAGDLTTVALENVTPQDDLQRSPPIEPGQPTDLNDIDSGSEPETDYEVEALDLDTIESRLADLQEGQFLLLTKEGTARVVDPNTRRRARERRFRDDSDSDTSKPIYTKDEIEELVPEGYSRIFLGPENIANLPERAQQAINRRQEQLKEFNEQQLASEWSAAAQSQLEIFFYNHEFTHQLVFEQLLCKESMCMILGKEARQGLFSLIRREMVQQPWYRELFIPSRGGGSSFSRGQTESVFYLTLERNNPE